MSLEDAILKLTAAVSEQNDLTRKLLARDPGAAPAEKTTKATTTKKTEKSAEDGADEGASTSEPDGITFEALSKKAMAWVTETGKGSPEQEARSAYLKENIWPKLKVESIKGLQGKPELIAKFDSWLENKAKTDLCGYGDGIFAKPADADGNTDDDSDL